MSTVADMLAVDPYLDLPLHGVQLIEASAGTGKTFTLATLVLRLVVERDLRLGQVLAVTFTEAATQELRARLRRRLALAADIAADVAAKHGDAATDSVATTPTDPAEDAEAALTRQIIHRQLQHEDVTALAARLRRAENEIDLAAIFTIHGFCTRVLGEHALQTGRTFDPPQLVASERELREELAADLWRSCAADADDTELLHMLWTGPDTLAADLKALLRPTPLLPLAAADDGEDPLPALQQAADALRSAFRAHGDDLRGELEAAIAGKLLNGNSYRADLTASLWPALQSWCEHGAGDASDTIHSHLDRLLPAKLEEKTNKNKTHCVSQSPLCAAVAVFLDAQATRQQWLAGRSIALLHRLRGDAVQRLADMKQTRRVQTYDDLIDGVADALQGRHADDLARGLRTQYAVALVDEFQDTDARQWSIFRRVFGCGDNAALFMIGDPKQAIYGFRGGDVHTYLAARHEASLAPPLSHNFRSRPGVLRAIQALYEQAGDAAFVDERIRFQRVEPGPGTADTDYQRNGKPAPALAIRVLPAAAKVEDSRDLVVDSCVAEIHGVLADARAGRATIKGAPVQPGDIAVLVRNHSEATRMQSALVAAGIAAVAAGRQSLLETEQAGELLAIFDALLQPADDGRLRAALATVLLGVDAAGIARLDSDPDWHQQQQLRALAWRERWQRHGPLALVSDLCAANAERLLGLVDGERRLTNLMQLGELLQQADARALGLHGLVDWLRTRIAHADADDEQQLLRLESDARRVQILTLHKSKGLEFDLVFLPFAGIGRKDGSPARNCEVPGDDGRMLHWRVPGEGKDIQSQRWEDAVAEYKQEQRAENARLLYVGLTRARQALWLATGPLYMAGATAQAAMVSDLQTLGDHADVSIDANDMPAALSPLTPLPTGAIPAARRAVRVLDRDWWVYSFTQLARADSGTDSSAANQATADERGASDEPLLPDPGVDGATPVDAADADAEPAAFSSRSSGSRFSGSRFGNVLHDALEHVDFDAWSGWRGSDAPAGQDAALRSALRAEGYAAADLDDGIKELTWLVGRTLTVDLPEGGRLCDVPATDRRAELEFHFAMQATPVDALLSTLHGHGVLRGRTAFGLRRQLEGLMTGKIDLTYTAGGRWYLLDYKSNRLLAYDRASLDAAMARSEYDLQALIYTVALHRWLRFRLGERYDYARDFGGVRYLFCRGLDVDTAGDTPQPPGIHAHLPPVELVDALDSLFGGGR